MPYLGNQPADKYSSFAVQHFTTSATSSYTLDFPIANENEIALFINNVRQEPGSSYAYTASGTSLTLSAATSASDTMYCVFIGKSVQTVTPANGTITSAMMSSSVNFSFPTLEYSAEATLTDGATIDWNLQTQQVAKVTLGGNRTMNAATNQVAGAFCSILVIQSAGSNTLSWDSTFKWTGATAPTLTTTASAKDLFVFRSDGTNLYEVGRSLNIG